MQQEWLKLAGRLLLLGVALALGGCGNTPGALLDPQQSLAAPTGMIPGTYSGTIFCDTTGQDLLTGLAFRPDSTTEDFDVGLSARGEILIDGATVAIGDRFLHPVAAGRFIFQVRDVLPLSDVFAIAYDVTGTIDSGTVQGARFEQFHFTPPAKILYLVEMSWNLIGDDLPTVEIFDKHCEGFLVP